MSGQLLLSKPGAFSKTLLSALMTTSAVATSERRRTTLLIMWNRLQWKSVVEGRVAHAWQNLP
jgi:hypothetical protein